MNRSDGITEHNQWRLIFQAFNMRNAITCTKIKLKKERKINCLPIFDHPVIQQISKKKKKRANEKRRVKTILELTNKLQKRKKKNQNRLSHSPYLIPCSTNQNMPQIKVIPIYIYIYKGGGPWPNY